MSLDQDLIDFYQNAELTILTPVGPVCSRYFYQSFALYQFHQAAGWKSGMFLAAPSLFVHPSDNPIISEARYRPRFAAELRSKKEPEKTIRGIYILNSSQREAVALIRAVGIELALFAANTKRDGNGSYLRILVSDTRNIPLVRSPMSKVMDKMTHDWRQKGIRVIKKKRRPKNAPPAPLIATFHSVLPPRRPTTE